MSLPAISVEVMFDNIALVGANTRSNTFDGGTNTTTITTGNSGGVSGNAFNSVAGSPQFTNTQAFGGSGLAAFNPSSGVDTHLDWSSVAQPGDVFCVRLYMYLVSATTGSQRVFVALGPSSGVVSALWLFSDRILRLYAGFSTTLAAQLTTPIPTGQWVRVELRYTIDGSGNGTGEVWLYTNPNSATPADYAISSTLAWPSGKPTNAELHLQRDAGGYWFLDNAAIAEAKIGAVAGTWSDVTSRLKLPLSIKRGSGRVSSPIIRYSAGTATVRLDNSDRRFDPTNLSGPHVSGGKSQVQPMRPIRIRAVWSAVTYNLFRGFADQWDVQWIANPGGSSQGYSLTVVPSTDGFKYLQNKKRSPTIIVVNGQPVTQTYGAGENAGARVTRILDSVAWPAADRVIATGNSPLQATSLSGDALSELQNVADSEVGEFYIDGQGRAVFRNRRAIFTDSRSTTVQATFGNPSTSIAPFETKLSSDDATLYNEVLSQREGGDQQTTGDSTSQSEYLTRTFSGSGLKLQTDGEALSWGQWIVYLSKDPETRFDTIAIHCHANPSVLFPAVLAREIGDRIQIVRRPPGGGTAITRDAFIRGISHDVTTEKWITTFQLQSARQFGAFFTLDDATNGLLGNGVPMAF
ncbi:MAG TPA: hypothetical protein VMZ00_09285 [Sporichthya sp.]|nr:hypothetical protein [Sporichthya sp.]